MKMNLVVLCGNLVRDPELRHLAAGTAVSDNTIAINEKYKDQEQTSFIDLTFWGKQAEVLCEYMKKGDLVLITGRLKQDKWQGADGKPVSKVRVTVDNFQMGPKKVKSTENSPSIPSLNESTTENSDQIPF